MFFTEEAKIMEINNKKTLKLKYKPNIRKTAVFVVKNIFKMLYLKRIVCIDGKTMRGNRQKEEKPLHIVSAWSKEDGFCMGQKAVLDYTI